MKKMVRHDFPYESHYVEVLGSKMHYVDTGGSGPTVVMIHGNPTWSYLWRNVIPHLEGRHRVIAFDLIGFGKSDKPDIQYRATDQAKYLEGFMDALHLDDTTLVLHDWGAILGFDYAAKHPDRVKAIAFMETIIETPPAEPPYGSPKPLIGTEKQGLDLPGFFEFLEKIKTPGVGEKMLLEENIFLEHMVIPSLANVLTEDELNAYREPFEKGKNKRPMLQFHRDVPIDGKTPDYTIQMMARYNKYLRTRENLPKLLLHLSEGYILIDRWKVEWIRNNIPDTQVHDMGSGGHFMQEYNPDGIGQAIALWMDKNKL
jgi:haloalkane dehalogenase